MQASTTLAGATILLVDDNVANLGVLTQLLTVHGVRVLVAQQGESGIQIAQRAQPDLILLDVQLPGLDGFAICRRLQAETSTAAIPVLFMTARIEAADKLKGFAAGGVDYITKPFQEEEVLARVRAHLRLRQLQQQLEAQNAQLQQEIVERQQAEEALQRAHIVLEQQVEERTAALSKMEALYYISHSLITIEQLPDLLQAVVDKVAEAIPADRVTLILFDLEKKSVPYFVKGGPGIEQLVSVPFDELWEGLSGWALRELKPALSPKGVPDARESPAVRRRRAETNAGAIIVTPLRYHEKTLGTMTGINRPEQPDFTQHDVELMLAMANQAAMTIENTQLLLSLRKARAELERRVEERTAELVKANAAEQRARRLAETLSAANLALTQTLDLDTILDTLLEYLEQLVPYDSASAMVYEADARLVVRSVRGAARWSDAQLTLNLALDVATSPQLRALLATQASIMIADTATAPLWAQHGGAADAHSWLGVPLIAGGMVIGLYTLDKREPGFFTEEHRQVAESLAAQAAVAMQNARLFAEVSAARTRLQAVSRQLVAVQEAERAQIARDLHDEIGQMLTALKLVLAIGSQGTPEITRMRLAEAQTLVNDLTTRVRQLSLDLRPAMLDDLGLLPTLLWYIKRYMQQTEIRVTLKHTGLEQRVASDLEIAVYRIVQEGLTNVARHAGVRKVTIRAWRTEEFIGVRIEDQGRGFVPEQMLTAYTSSGLAGMVERVRLLEGQLTIESAPGQGTRLIAELPLGDSLT
jgi:signal transduction histidine kinase/DNA-binding response OmpR family regulator